MIDNDLLDERFTRGTEFETNVGELGKHELKRIVRESNYVTKRFRLSTDFSESEYQILGDEIANNGGF